MVESNNSKSGSTSRDWTITLRFVSQVQAYIIGKERYLDFDFDLSMTEPKFKKMLFSPTEEGSVSPTTLMFRTVEVKNIQWRLVSSVTRQHIQDSLCGVCDRPGQGHELASINAADIRRYPCLRLESEEKGEYTLGEGIDCGPTELIMSHRSDPPTCTGTMEAKHGSPIIRQ